MGKEKKLKESRKSWEAVLSLTKKYKIELPDQLKFPPAGFDGTPIHQKMIIAFLEKVALFLGPLDKERSDVALRESTRNVLRSFDNHQNLLPLAIKFDESSGPTPLACKAGCNHCCTLRVTAPAPEVINLASYLRKKLSEDEMQSLLARIAAFESETATLSPIKQIRRVSMCPLNVEGFCIGYANRPLSCSGYHSFSLPKCVDFMNNREAKSQVPQDPERLMLRGMHTEATHVALQGVQLDDTELEFVPALRIALKDDTAGTKYLLGEPVFKEADKPDVRAAQDGVF